MSAFHSSRWGVLVDEEGYYNDHKGWHPLPPDLPPDAELSPMELERKANALAWYEKYLMELAAADRRARAGRFAASGIEEPASGGNGDGR